ncbi:MAG: alpha-hydroxy acid oxidase [Beijerinckiaceae bacterium]|nr:alpha-hydroxy acid oxidase [Beijerinckiaceae bacterium]
MDATREIELARAYPTAFDLRERARRLMPKFAFGYMDGGSGHDDLGIRRNWDALDAIELLPRYGLVARPPECRVKIFGREYSAPLGISPIGGPGTAYPGAELYLAAAAQKMNVPYTLGLLSGIDVEQAAKVCPDVLWYQLYRFARNDHAIGLDLARRAAAAGVTTLVLTMDTPTRTIRPRETKSGIQHPFRVTWRLRLDALSSPRWIASFFRNGMPRFAALKPYMKEGATLEEATEFIRHESGGAFTWDEVAKYRDAWKGRLVLKGILHPGDARKAVQLGADGVIVSNHGGRQIDCLPAAIDVLPKIVSEVSGRVSVLFDSGVRSGVDVARAFALGADAAFSGKAFLWSLGALGSEGPEHFIRVLTNDLRACMGQLGCREVSDLRLVEQQIRNGTKCA